MESTSSQTLSLRESHLLAAFIALRFDLFALARQESLLPADLLAFTQSPAIRSHLAALKQAAEDAFALRSLEARSAALDALALIAQSTPDLVEKRRAASTIIRGLQFRTSSRHGTTPTSPIRHPPDLAPHPNNTPPPSNHQPRTQAHSAPAPVAPRPISSNLSNFSPAPAGAPSASRPAPPRETTALRLHQLQGSVSSITAQPAALAPHPILDSS